jgi:hypothetical protein
MTLCKDDGCEAQCFDDTLKELKGHILEGAAMAALVSLDACGGMYSCFNYGDTRKVQEVQSTTEPCCNKACKAPLEKYFSTDAPHGFCGEACMDPAFVSTYHRYLTNLTKATSDHPCSEQLTPSNTKRYTDYFQTETNLWLYVVTVDLYAPHGMPDHSCCVPLLSSLNCVGIPGKPKSMKVFGTGPYCCPASATETAPCTSDVVV